jgi:hypothetical protein
MVWSVGVGGPFGVDFFVCYDTTGGLGNASLQTPNRTVCSCFYVSIMVILIVIVTVTVNDHLSIWTKLCLIEK